MIVQVKWKRYEKLALSTNISLYFKNYTRNGHSYSGRRIVMVPFPWVTTKYRFQGHDITQRQITRKWCMIQL